MKKTKNAFTLIELLAVIVILAIIALIATPIILGIVEDAKKDAFLRSVELVISTTDIDIANKTFEEEYTYEITDGNISNLEVSVKNTDGMNGSITYDIEGKEVYAIHNGVYCVKKTADMSKAEISDYVEDECTLIIENATPEECFGFSDGTITSYGGPNCPADIIIPSKINGVAVTAIGERAFVYNSIDSIKFPNTLVEIKKQAFQDAEFEGELDLSYLPNLTTIESLAFYNYESKLFITSVKLPSSITTIESGAFKTNTFSSISGLTSVTFYGRSDLTGVSISDYSFTWADGYNNENGIHFVNE